ncbi:hypothetical protein ABTL76_19570, partial [Acinetobacter baumannii]
GVRDGTGHIGARSALTRFAVCAGESFCACDFIFSLLPNLIHCLLYHCACNPNLLNIFYIL